MVNTRHEMFISDIQWMKLIYVLHVSGCSSICGFSVLCVDFFFQEQATAVFLQDYLKRKASVHHNPDCQFVKSE